MVAVSGPGTQTRDGPGRSSPVNARATVGKGERATHDAVLDRTTGGAPEVTRWCPAPRRGRPARCAARNAATGSSADVTGRGGADVALAAAGPAEQPGVGRVHAARDQGGDDHLARSPARNQR